MYLQLHDNLQQGGFSNVPNLNLPDDFKIPRRQILIQAAEEGSQIAIEEFEKALAKAEQQGNEQAIKDALPTIDLDLLDLEEIDEFDETIAGRQMNGWWASLLKVGKFLLKYGKLIYDFISKATKTVNLVKVNNQIQSYYDANQYGFRNLNSMNKGQIDAQIKMLTGDYLNAVNSKDQVKASATARMINGYQRRKDSLPLLSQQQLLIGGGLLLAYLMFRK
jgi:hypothetical protein